MDDLDLDYGPDGLAEEREVAAVAKERSCLPDGHGRVDWARVREHLIEHKASKGRNPDGSLMATAPEAVEPVTITTPRHSIETAELPMKPKALAKRAEEAGWTVHAGRSMSHKDAALYVSDSDEDAPTPYRAGDIRYPAEDRTHYVVNAMADPRIGFRMYYTTRHKPSGDATSFIVGDAKDPVSGRMVVFDGGTVKNLSTDANLTTIMNPDDFAAWFDALVPPAEPRTPRKPRKSKSEKTADAMLAGEEWQ